MYVCVFLVIASYAGLQFNKFYSLVLYLLLLHWIVRAWKLLQFTKIHWWLCGGSTFIAEL